ncbi:hypothetical protein F4801DRAFT_549957 [Xylaria longipes]|nr:hypothetical protein F4801DRAFT_549957 [Xylaria longipes]
MLPVSFLGAMGFQWLGPCGFAVNIQSRLDGTRCACQWRQLVGVETHWCGTEALAGLARCDWRVAVVRTYQPSLSGQGKIKPKYATPGRVQP